ncbi:hypothetical protein DERP_012826 [Dermatophagoides pteronyssinus]|uniref:Uncharacterized protein n=1 Tax=Dermatophagoides pteronyssinus TaxID=6956 RepID=A0ABQ8JF88_DERPT|nr:hypothetical protein DERP_012826 [Dermatophagoides pteronyssinus]
MDILLLHRLPILSTINDRAILIHCCLCPPPLTIERFPPALQSFENVICDIVDCICNIKTIDDNMAIKPIIRLLIELDILLIIILQED